MVKLNFVLHFVTHLHNVGQFQVVVEHDDVSILASFDRTLSVVYTHNLSRGFASHAASVFQGDVSLLNAGANQAVHCGNRAGECRAVCQFANTIFQNYAGGRRLRRRE